MKSLSINLPQHSYPIIWENDLNALEHLIKEKTKQGKHFVITNQHIFSLYQSVIERLFGESEVLCIEDGESYKNFNTITDLADQLLKKGANRKSTLWAFGGGVIGDITGFLASIYMRGIPFYQVPTTLLSMVDSSVGGKTGVNLEHGKNMIGTFYQPEGVFIHVNFLKTLDEREFRSGLSEVVKSALLGDPKLFQYIKENITEINKHVSETRKRKISKFEGGAPNLKEHLMEEISYRSVQVKANVVTQDEKETGLRAILNLGHTLAHALESFYNYTAIKHGEAVSIGISYAAFLSFKKGYLKEADYLQIQSFLAELNMNWKWEHLPHIFKKYKEDYPGKPQACELIDLMKGDKKNTDDSIRFILLKGIGDYTLPEPVDIPTIKNTLEEFICL